MKKGWIVFAVLMAFNIGLTLGTYLSSSPNPSPLFSVDGSFLADADALAIELTVHDGTPHPRIALGHVLDDIRPLTPKAEDLKVAVTDLLRDADFLYAAPPFDSSTKQEKTNNVLETIAVLNRIGDIK